MRPTRESSPKLSKQTPRSSKSNEAADVRTDVSIDSTGSADMSDKLTANADDRESIDAFASAYAGPRVHDSADVNAPVDATDGHITLTGLHNTRDLGYLKTAAGQPLAPHKLIRSGALGLATTDDIDTLVVDFGLRTVVDLRTPEEREKEPDPFDEMPSVHFVDAPILGFSSTGITRENGLVGMTKTLATLKRDPKQLMIDLYPNMLLSETGIEGYRKFFDTLIANEKGAVLWHCSAGKDRAGLASVLLLYVLGVSAEDIRADYLATNKYLANREDSLKKLIPDRLLSDSLISALKTLNSADSAFLDAGIKGVEQAYGSVDAYISDALGVDEGIRNLLRSRYLLP